MTTFKILFTALLAAFYGAIQVLDAGAQNFAGQAVSFMETRSTLPAENEQKSCAEGKCLEDFNYKDAATVHEPFANGECSLCHPADTDKPLSNLTTQESIELCYSCHPVESLGNSHPIGEAVINPVTNKAVTCSSCHPAHYSSKAFLLNLDARGELCVSCHTNFISSP